MYIFVCVCVYEIFVGHFNVKGRKVNGFSLPKRGNLWLFLLLGGCCVVEIITAKITFFARICLYKHINIDTHLR